MSPQSRDLGANMTGKTKGILWAVILVILGVLAWRIISHAKTSVGSAERATAFQLRGIDGRTYSLASWKGQPVFLNFFASWCPPCRSEAPDLAKAARQYGKAVAFVGIDLTKSENSLADVRAFIKQYHLTYPVLLDESGTTSANYLVRVIPTSIFITRQGTIQSQVVGRISPTQLAAHLKAIMAK